MGGLQGTLIHHDFTDYSFNPAQQTSIWNSATSWAAPVVSGIAAILLQQNWGYTLNDITNSIAQNADKVNGINVNGGGPGTVWPYDYGQYAFLPGYDKEMFFGRVNCGNALRNPVVGIQEQSRKTVNVKLAYLNEKEAMLIFSPGGNKSGSILTIFDISGNQVSSQKIEPSKTKASINTETFLNSVYLFKVTSLDNNSFTTFKYIK